MPAKETLTPDVRFGASFLDEAYREKAVRGEVLIDKVDAELFLKRPLDGRLISFMRRYTDLYDTIEELNIQIQNHPEFVYPYTDSFFLSMLYDVRGVYGEDVNILLNDLKFTNLQNNDRKMEFQIAPGSNGFFVKAKTRTNDRKSVSFLNFMYNKYEDQKMITRPAEYDSIDYWDNGGVILSYEVTTKGTTESGEESSVITSGSTGIRLNENSVIILPDKYNYNLKTITDITVRITEMNFPKLQTMYGIYSELDDLEAYPFKDYLLEVDNAAYVKELEVWSFIQNEKDVPDCFYMFVNQFIDVYFMNEVMEKVKKVGDGNGVIPAAKRPPNTVWTMNNAWAETIRSVTAGNVKTQNDCETNITELEKYLYYMRYVNTEFTFDRNNEAGLLIVEI
ncbi:MAG TPA: hypothetical protein DCW90_07195 [Lachnospiraceae bacterium]|nr:hypothetical protein [Lachnospiraceae bacterium]